MIKLIILYIGTIFLAYLSQRFCPVRHDGITEERHFMHDRTDIFCVAIIIWLTLFNGLKVSYNDTGNYIAFFQDSATTLSEHFATSTETGFADNPLYYITQLFSKKIIDNYHVWFLLTSFFNAWIVVKFEGNAEEFRKRKITPAGQQHVLPGAGVNLERFAYHACPQNEKVHFLYLGRIMREKGMDELFGAVRKLHEENADFVLDLVGFFEDEYKEQVDSLVKDGIAVFHGFQPDPVPFYAAADCVVLPSYHEGMSNVLLEAAAVGRPIITSDIPGCREAVDDRKSGLLCKVKDASSLYEQMRRMLGSSFAERESMGQAAHEKMVREFDKQRGVSETMASVLGLEITIAK